MISVKITVNGIVRIVTLKYSLQVIFTLLFFSICIQINVANVPVGRRSDPISLPIIFARYMVFKVNGSSDISVKAMVPIISAGWLLNKLERTDRSKPIIKLALKRLSDTSGSSCWTIRVVSPTFCSP